MNSLKNMFAMLIAAVVTGIVFIESSTIWRNPDISFWEGAGIAWLGGTILHLLILLIVLMAMTIFGGAGSLRAHMGFGALVSLAMLVIMALAEQDFLLLIPSEVFPTILFGILVAVLWFGLKRAFGVLPEGRKP